MTVSAYSPKKYHPGSAMLAEAVGFAFLAPGDVVVEHEDEDGLRTVLALDTHYELAGDGPAGTATVRALAEYPADDWFHVYRDAEALQPTALPPHGPLPSKDVETVLDRVVMVLQQFVERLLRVMVAPVGETIAALPSAAARAGKFLGFDVSGDPVALSGTGADSALRDDLASAGAGASLVNFPQAGTGSATQSIRDKLRSTTVHLMDKIDKAEWAAIEAGTTTFDASAALVNAAALGKRIILPSGKVLANLASIDNGFTLEGEDGHHSVLAAYDTGTRLITADSGGASTYLRDIYLGRLTLLGMATPTFSEHIHLLSLNGVDNVLIDMVRFVGFRGDGLYLGSGTIASQERHNRSVTVRKCTFDGVNRANRQAISVIDADGVRIEDCDFRTTTAPTMPGAIDFEPDTDAYHSIRDAVVSGCRFEGIGGNLGAIAVYIPSPVTGFVGLTIENNSFDNYAGTGADISLSNNRLTTESDSSWAVRISGNRGYNGNAPYHIFSMKGVQMDESNVWDTYAQNAVEGWNGAADLLRQAVLRPRLRNIAGPRGRLGRNIADVEIGGSLEYCGDDSASAYPFQFSGGASSRVTIRGLRVKKRASQTIAINNDGHTFSSATNRAADNDLDGLNSQFTASAPGQVLSGSLVWDPGSLADGAGETSVQIPVAGAAFGDTVRAAAPYDLQGVTVSAYVTAADYVRIRIQNESGGTVDFASGTWKVSVTKALN